MRRKHMPPLALALVLAVGCDAPDPVGVTDGAGPATASDAMVVAGRDLGSLIRWNAASPARTVRGPLTVRSATEDATGTISAENATGTVVYDAIPEPLPGSYPALSFHQTRTNEWGDHVLLTEGGKLGAVTVGLSSWACENDDTRGDLDACESTPGSSFSHAVTASLYEVDLSGEHPAVGPLIATLTETFDIPFRPSWDGERCFPPTFNPPYGGQWYDPVLDMCVDGFATTARFDFSGEGVVLPDQVIFGVAFNTQTAGAEPIGAPGPYDLLTLGVANFQTAPPPSVGADAEADYTFWSTELANWYCDGGAAGFGFLRRDGCWSGLTPMVRIELAAEPADEPVTPRSLVGSGWWTEAVDAQNEPRERTSLTAAVRSHARTGELGGQLDIRLGTLGVELRARSFHSFTLAGDLAVLEGEGQLAGDPVEFALEVGEGAGPEGADMVTLVVREAGPGGAVLYDSGGSRALEGGALKLLR